MEQEQQQKSSNMVVFLIGSAVFLAVATFIAILLLSSRPSSEETVSAGQGDLAAPTNFVTVNGSNVRLNVDPNKVIQLVSEINQIQPAAAEQEIVTTPSVTPIPTPAGPTATPAPPPPTRDPRPVIFISYTVVQGDTLYTIADAQNSSIELMAKHGYDADDLNPGSVLPELPIANPAYCPGMRAYVVRDKDTVFRIAAQFGTTVEAIVAANGLGPDYGIEVTQVICIPA